jgi:hypothetical protein
LPLPHPLHPPLLVITTHFDSTHQPRRRRKGREEKRKRKKEKRDKDRVPNAFMISSQFKSYFLLYRRVCYTCEDCAGWMCLVLLLSGKRSLTALRAAGTSEGAASAERGARSNFFLSFVVPARRLAITSSLF